MKKLLAVMAFMIFAAAGARASNYPPDYTWQYVRAVSKGPAVVAMVSSGITGKLVIGYKKSGILGARQSISAVVRVTAKEYYSGYTKTTEKVISIPREWHGTGFMTQGLSMYDFIHPGFAGSVDTIEVAFFDGPQWDSNYGANYLVNRWDWDNAPSFTSKPGGYDIDVASWDFIVKQMGK